MVTFFDTVLQSVLLYLHVFVYSTICTISMAVGEDIVIKTQSGPVKGYESVIGNVSIYTFKNIPFAKPPIGDLRFELPQHVVQWHSVEDLKNHTVEVSCPQPSGTDVYGQEDCLLLDVYLRKNSEAKSLLPVLIYYPAGRFARGSKGEYHPEYLLSLHDLIVVIPNYRLGILGFLHAGDSQLPGNLGLFDQRQSMRWVHKNIESFGGDRHKVTIAGHGAGAASVGFHILSAKSHEFFRAAISASGTALDPWALSRTSAPTVTYVAEKLNCSGNSSNSVISCLKQININKILEAQVELKNVQFLPTIDASSEFPFLPHCPKKLYQLGYQKNITYIAGVTRNEASIEVASEFPDALKHKHLDSIIQHLLGPYLRESPYLHIIAKAAKYQYLRGAVIPTFDSIQPQMEAMMSDFLYNSPLHETLQMHSLRTPHTFMYVFDYEDEHSPLGVSHMRDAYYLFDKIFGKWMPKNNFETYDMKKTLCDIWGNFIESKTPGPHSVWKKFRDNNQMNYVEISEKLSHRTNYRKEAMEFWMLLVPDLKYYLNLTTVQPTTPYEEDTSYISWGLAGAAVLLMVLCVAMVGVVTVTRRRYSFLLPISLEKDDIDFENMG